MISVRAATLCLGWDQTSKEDFERLMGSFCPMIRSSLQEANFALRTTRLLLDPLNRWQKIDRFGANSVLRWISDLCEKNEVRWFCLPFMAQDRNDVIRAREMGLEFIRRYPNAFLSFAIAVDGKFNPTLFNDLSRFVLDVSKISANGYDNFRVGFAANCAPNGPFFPYTRQEGPNGFSLALEIPSTFLRHLRDQSKINLEEFRDLITLEIAPQLQALEAIAQKVESSCGLVYNGLDLSLAPFPDADGSVAEIIERVGVESFGAQGSLFAISYLTDILKHIAEVAGVKTVGFNGVMISVLEDRVLGQANNKKMYSLDSVMAYSTVCGCGIDMVPLPGNVLPEELSSLFLDIAALSTALKKPLGIRTLPIPGLGVNDQTNFSYDFLFNSRVMDIRNRCFLFDGFNGTSPFSFQSRQRK